MTEYEILSLVVASLALMHSVYVGYKRRKDEKKLRELESTLAKYQTEKMASDVDPAFEPVGFGWSETEENASLSLRAKGPAITNVEVESHDGYESRIAGESIWYSDDIVTIVFEGAEKEYPKRASFTLRFTNSLGMARANDYVIEQGEVKRIHPSADGS
jgi:hypothetical protein